MNVLLTFQKINTFPHQTFFNPLKWMETDAKLSLCKCKHFQKERGKELFSVIFYTIKQLAILAQKSREIHHVTERFFSKVIIYSSHTGSTFPSHQESPGPFVKCRALSYYTASYLTTYSGLICMPGKVGFCPSESWWAPCGLIPLILEHQILCCHGKATREISWSTVLEISLLSQSVSKFFFFFSSFLLSA